MGKAEAEPLPVSLSMPSAASRGGGVAKIEFRNPERANDTLAFAIAAPEIRKFPGKS
jgi:hypothetical protein